MKGAASGVNRRQKCSQTTQHEIVQENEEWTAKKKKITVRLQYKGHACDRRDDVRSQAHTHRSVKNAKHGERRLVRWQEIQSPSQENKTVGENRVEVTEQAKDKTQCVRLPPGVSLGCCERPQRPITPLEPDFGRQRFFFCHVTLVTIWSFSKPHPRRVFRASMQHVDELTGESKCAYFQWKESDENATFQSKETQDHKTLPAVHSIQKDCRPEQWRCRRRAMLSNGLSSGCTNNVPTYAKICADDTDDSRH